MSSTLDLNSNGIAEVELIYKALPNASTNPLIRSAEDAYSVLRSCWDENKLDFVEQFKILLLNQAKRVIGIVPISTGSITSTVVDPRVCFAAALKANATSIIMAHNHPSQNISPSSADREITTKMQGGGKLLDIQVLDHLIVCRNGYYSFADENYSIVYGPAPQPPAP